METAEKYISIEYNKWENFYKPLENAFIELGRDYDALKASKKIDIYVGHTWDYNRSKYKVGTIESKSLIAVDIYNQKEAFESIGLDFKDKTIFARVINDLVHSQAPFGHKEFLTKFDLIDYEKGIEVLRKKENKIKLERVFLERDKNSFDNQLAYIQKLKAQFKRERAGMVVLRFFANLFKKRKTDV